MTRPLAGASRRRGALRTLAWVALETSLGATMAASKLKT